MLKTISRLGLGGTPLLDRFLWLHWTPALPYVAQLGVRQWHWTKKQRFNADPKLEDCIWAHCSFCFSVLLFSTPGASGFFPYCSLINLSSWGCDVMPLTLQWSRVAPDCWTSWSGTPTPLSTWQLENVGDLGSLGKAVDFSVSCFETANWMFVFHSKGQKAIPARPRKLTARSSDCLPRDISSWDDTIRFADRKKGWAACVLCDRTLENPAPFLRNGNDVKWQWKPLNFDSKLESERFAVNWYSTNAITIRAVGQKGVGRQRRTWFLVSVPSAFCLFLVLPRLQSTLCAALRQPNSEGRVDLSGLTGVPRLCEFNYFGHVWTANTFLQVQGCIPPVESKPTSCLLHFFGCVTSVCRCFVSKPNLCTFHPVLFHCVQADQAVDFAIGLRVFRRPEPLRLWAHTTLEADSFDLDQPRGHGSHDADRVRFSTGSGSPIDPWYGCVWKWGGVYRLTPVYPPIIPQIWQFI